MPDSLDVAKVDGYLRITFSGLFSPESARYCVRAMLAACVKENCDKILFDCTPMTGTMSAVDRFEVAEYSASILPRTLKIAVLGRQDQILPDNFFENVARNQGLTLTVFSEIDDAIKWLDE
jgi:hypothetical protein